MLDRLLDRQTSLLAHLTSSAGIFGAARSLSNEPALHGLDLGLLHLEARFSHEKRMQKIEWVLTQTFAHLGDSRWALARDFADTYPPTGISWLENARQFHDFLIARWRRQVPAPPHLPDLAAYEMAYATVRAGGVERGALAQAMPEAPPGSIRRHPGILLLRCAYDIRSILEGRDHGARPERRETRLAIKMPPGTDEPRVLEVSDDLFEMLEMLDAFVDAAVFQDFPEAAQLIGQLAEDGLIEVRL
jgi:hypothetical protein